MTKRRPFEFQLGAFDIEGAAAYLSVSREFFNEHVRPDLRVIRKGRKVLVPRSELERWIQGNAARTLES